MKRLDLYGISFETFEAKLITEASYALADRVARERYSDLRVDAIFSGTTILSMEMLNAMLDDFAFANADNFMGAIGGLGDAHQFSHFFDTHVLIEMNRKNPLSAFEVMLYYHGSGLGFGTKALRQTCLDAINQMFSLMDNNALGVGVFQDPFVAMAAYFLGFEEARSLKDMESITFIMEDDGKIRVLGINEVTV